MTGTDTARKRLTVKDLASIMQDVRVWLRDYDSPEAEAAETGFSDQIRLLVDEVHHYLKRDFTLVEVSGGVAEVTIGSADILDWDNLKDPDGLHSGFDNLGQIDDWLDYLKGIPQTGRVPGLIAELTELRAEHTAHLDAEAQRARMKRLEERGEI
jgi:hypothetical protein